ncbi:MAG: hypothetical protein JW834_02655 [Candidatus Diapherotrites archaeon]|nr:hypothetical protein [Candidatus Diapherotrites archaeon]
MVEFELLSGLTGAQLRVRRKKQTDLISINRPFYKDILEVKWFNAKYSIIRSGLIVRTAKIYKNGEYIGSIKERLGIMSHFDVYRKAKKLFDIHEHETILQQEFKILKDNKEIGKIAPLGVYVPILSSIGKGLSGHYQDMLEEEEELLLMTVIALGI